MLMNAQTMRSAGRRYKPAEQSEAHCTRSLANGTLAEADLPPFPEVDAKGNCPAIEFIRVSIARDVIRERMELGLTQEQLAKLAHVRLKTLSRLESGRYSPTIRAVDKIDRALKMALSRK